MCMVGQTGRTCREKNASRRRRYIANSIFRVSIYGEGWSELGWQVLALACFIALFVVPILVFALRWGRSSRKGLLAISS